MFCQLTQTVRQEYMEPLGHLNKIQKFAGPVKEICEGYLDEQNGVDKSVEKVAKAGTAAATTVGVGVASAAAAGAGSLAGYAGMASAVSGLGLGGVTTAIAGAMGSSATGAAATAVVTVAVGGPVVMGAILVSGAGAAAYGTYQIGKWIHKQVNS
jgi:hypothetical protein